MLPNDPTAALLPYMEVAACAGLRSCGKGLKKDVRRDCRIIGTTPLGKDVYKCNTETSASRPMQGTRQRRLEKSKLKVQALVKQLVQHKS